MFHIRYIFTRAVWLCSILESAAHVCVDRWFKLVSSIPQQSSARGNILRRVLELRQSWLVVMQAWSASIFLRASSDARQLWRCVSESDTCIFTMLSFSLCCSVLCITTQQTSVKYEFSLSHTETSVPQHKSHTSVQVVRKQQQFEGVRHGEGDPPPHWGWGSGGAVPLPEKFFCVFWLVF